MQAVYNFLSGDKGFILYMLLAVGAALLLMLRGVRRIGMYALRNSLYSALYIGLSAACAPFGWALNINALTLVIPLLLGFPGVGLAIVLPVVMKM